jgi:hypothetical protein
MSSCNFAHQGSLLPSYYSRASAPPLHKHRAASTPLLAVAPVPPPPSGSTAHTTDPIHHHFACSLSFHSPRCFNPAGSPLVTVQGSTPIRVVCSFIYCIIMHPASSHPCF